MAARVALCSLELAEASPPTGRYQGHQTPIPEASLEQKVRKPPTRDMPRHSAATTRIMRAPTKIVSNMVVVPTGKGEAPIATAGYIKSIESKEAACMKASAS